MSGELKNMRTVHRLVVASSEGVRQGYGGAVEVCCVACRSWKTLPHFGLRYMEPSGELRSQSWCNQCRAEGRKEAARGHT